MSNVRINPVAPDRNPSGRYGASDEGAHRESYAREEESHPLSDRLEISRDARETYRRSESGPDLDFARKALEKAPPLSDSRLAQILDRIESGYYRLPAILSEIVFRMNPVLH